MIPEEEIINNIKDMGYITVTPRALYPSYYKLNDGTIIKALAQIHGIVPDPKNPDGFGINSSNVVNAFVPKEKRSPERFFQYDPADLVQGIVEDDMDFEVLRENFSVYDLSNGFVLSVKTVAGQVRKTKYFSKDGEPVYIVNTNPIIKVKKK